MKRRSFFKRAGEMLAGVAGAALLPAVLPAKAAAVPPEKLRREFASVLDPAGRARCLPDRYYDGSDEYRGQRWRRWYEPARCVTHYEHEATGLRVAVTNEELLRRGVYAILDDALSFSST